jgi:hypothetical protein
MNTCGGYMPASQNHLSRFSIEVKRHYVHDVVAKMQEYREGTRMAVLSHIQFAERA